MCLAQGQQYSDAGKAQTCGPSASSQALYHCAPLLKCWVASNATQMEMLNDNLLRINNTPSFPPHKDALNSCMNVTVKPV